MAVFPACSLVQRYGEKNKIDMDSYERYEKERKIIRKENKNLLAAFEAWMSNQNLSKKTVNKHSANVDFYINEFLQYEETIKAVDGVDMVDMFLGYWFIKKVMWASKTTIKENATSLKKFYQYLLDLKMISKESYEDLKEMIKESMPEWLKTLEKYDNPDIDDSENSRF